MSGLSKQNWVGLVIVAALVGASAGIVASGREKTVAQGLAAVIDDNSTVAFPPACNRCAWSIGKFELPAGPPDGPLWLQVFPAGTAGVLHKFAGPALFYEFGEGDISSGPSGLRLGEVYGNGGEALDLRFTNGLWISRLSGDASLRAVIYYRLD